jgi:hypothetical protein
MKKIEIVNIPGYTSSYYVLALSKSGHKLHVKPEKKFEKYNYATCLLIRVDGKLIVIDNDDPLRVIEDLYEESTAYFMTNKAIDKPEFNRDGIYPLFPHYPVNTLWLYIKLFHWHLMKPKMLKKALTVLYTIYTRPKYVNIALNHSKKRYVFFCCKILEKGKSGK